ncbi:hypothetical protein ACFVS2_20625 [Brevibacillus sp. NPDC058079]|uniref:hypothetical protein n=1 Tax=Brevibacillus sp. NPDC058079 TaxID=3346330 RepID=UPI0036E83999
MHHLDLWRNDQKRKRDMMIANDIALLNRQLQELLHRMIPKIDQTKYQQEAERAGCRKLVKCTIWNIAYRNNMENPDVVLCQGLFIAYLLNSERNLEEKNLYVQKLDALMRRFRNIEWAKYRTYLRLKGQVAFI